MMTKKKHKIIWFIWAVIYPLGYFTAYRFTPYVSVIFTTGYFTFVLLGLLVAFFHFDVRSTSIYLINCVSLATFLLFGLFAEMLVTQIMVVVLLLRIQISKDKQFRYPINPLIFQVLSLASGIVYHLTYDAMPQLMLQDFNILPAFLYMFLYMTLNDFLIKMIQRYVYDKDYDLYSVKYLTTILTLIYHIPVGLLLVFLYVEMDIFGAIIMAIPLLTVYISSGYYFKMQEANHYLTKANELAQRLYGHRERGLLADTYVEELPKNFPVERIELFDWKREVKHVRSYDDSKQKMVRLSQKISSSTLQDSLIKEVLEEDKMLSFDKGEEWVSRMPTELDIHTYESLIAFPIKRCRRVVGAIFLFHSKPKTYKSDLARALQVLQNFFNVALEQVRRIESIQEQSQTDHLTHLPNLRGLEKMIEAHL